MTDRYTKEELFGDQFNGEQYAKVLRMTPALENGFHPNRSFVRPQDVSLIMLHIIFSGAMQSGDSINKSQRQRAEYILLGRQLNDGSWGTAHVTLRSVVALHLQGYTAENKTITEALTSLVRAQTSRGRLPPYRMSVFDTAVAIRALTASGLRPGNESLDAAAQWLVNAKTTPRRGINPPPPLMFRDHTGHGWGHKVSVFSDWDDTAVAISALTPYHDALVRRDVKFLFAVQNDDGTWSSFTTNYSPLTPAERRKAIDIIGYEGYQYLFVDSPANSVMGHALEALGKQGYTVENNASIRKTAMYLLNHTDANGLWGSTWGLEYTYGTATVLVGLNEVNANMDHPVIQRAVRTLLAHQNPDGGWGEYWTSTQPDHQAWGPSKPAQTAWAIQALLAAGVSPDHRAIQRGIGYLIEHQRSDGSWKPHQSMVMGGGAHTYRDGTVTQASVLMALSMYADAQEISTVPDQIPQGPLSNMDLHPFAVSVRIVAIIGSLGWYLRQRWI